MNLLVLNLLAANFAQAGVLSLEEKERNQQKREKQLKTYKAGFIQWLQNNHKLTIEKLNDETGPKYVKEFNKYIDSIK